MSTARTQSQRPAPAPWPDKPLICIVSGYESGVGLVNGALAMRDAAGCYRLEGGDLLCPGTGDVIETWEEMTAVPVYQAPRSTRVDSTVRYPGLPEAACPACTSRMNAYT